MNQLGNLAVICAKRPEVLMQVYDGMVSVYVNFGPERTYMMAAWNDDEKISKIIHELNHGKYAVKQRHKNHRETTKKAA
ncbi:MAG: hypothetical protein J6B76_08020 [Peptococcaceae bacterium]|nr:hypothetical protein [Peptococcaceae bacterium]